jgi:hypothetical protein
MPGYLSNRNITQNPAAELAAAVVEINDSIDDLSLNLGV